MSWAIAADTLDEQRLLKVASMIVRYPQDTSDSDEVETSEQRAQRFQWIATEKDLVPYLMRLLDFNYRIHPNDGLASVLEAISLRSDLSAGDLAKITDEMWELIKTPWGPKRWLSEDYLSWGVLVLRNYPSVENKRLALILLERPTSDHNSILMRVNAARSLAKIGSAEDFPLVRKAAAEMKLKYEGRADFWIGKMEEALVDFQKRSHNESTPSPPTTPAIQASAFLQQAPSGETVKWSKWWMSGGLISILILLVTWLIYLARSKNGVD